ncbi:hypothetical protein [Halegenticoccus soli]|nr:hypothetical protein [Halegenticoccus soli]
MTAPKAEGSGEADGGGRTDARRSTADRAMTGRRLPVFISVR